MASVLLLCVGLQVQAAAEEDWVAYSPAGTGEQLGCDQSLVARRALAVDGAGNSYMAGCYVDGSEYGFLTLKYGPNGNLLWQRKYRGPGSWRDIGYSLALDGNQGVVVNGLSARTVPVQSIHYTTIKYDPAGNLLWQAQIEGAEANTALTVDGNGNVYVAGATPQSAGDLDYQVVKYNRSGMQQWVREHDGGHGTDLANGVVVNAAGQVHVSGATTNAAGRLEMTTRKYDGNGNLLWSSSFPTTGRSNLPRRMALDSAGNVIVAGTSTGSGEDRQFLTLKYNASGALQWQRLHDAYVGPYEDSVYDMAIAPDDEIVLTGRAAANADWNMSTIRYTVNGDVRWSRLDGSGRYEDAKALLIDAEGNVLITGEAESFEANIGRRFNVLKISAAGDLLWEHLYQSADAVNSSPDALAFSGDGGILVAGNETDQDDNTFITLVKLLETDGTRVFRNGFEP